MPFANEHAARLIQDGRFTEGSFRRIKLTRGVDAIIGRLKGQQSTTRQSIRFDKNIFTAREARKWLSDRDIKVILFEPAESSTTQIQEFSGSSLITQIEEMEGDELREHLTEEEIDKIKKDYPHPVFAIFKLAHEGESTGRMLQIPRSEQMPKLWPADKIQEVADKSEGAPVYYKHNKDDLHREKVGSIIKTVTKKIGGKLFAMGVVLIKNEQTKKDIKKGLLDLCSIESTLEVTRQIRNYIVSKVVEVSGLALGSSKDISILNQGFAGAGLVTAIQEFEVGEKMNDKSEIKLAIEKAGLNADDLFTENDIMALKPVQAALTAQQKADAGKIGELTKDVREAREKTDTEGLTKKLVDMTTERDKALGEIKKTELGSKMTGLFETHVKNKNLDDKERALVMKRLSSAVPDNAEISEDDLKKWISDKAKVELDNIDETRAMYGKEPLQTEKKAPIEQGNVEQGGDMSDPANNDLIPQ